MIDDQLAEQAALYAVGAMTAEERELFEPILEFHCELRAHVASLLDLAAATAVAHPPASRPQPCPSIKSRVMAATEDRPQTRGSGLVVTGPDRRVQWVNAAFSEMCGYSLDELTGKSLGPILQGEKTDRAVADHMRHAVHEGRACHETILNYHKDGTPYWVEIDIRPFPDDAGRVRWLVAREREITDLAIPA
jgi:PAS domain S-box-containing protein